jgi:sugar lactone lactonase YvrE
MSTEPQSIGSDRLTTTGALLGESPYWDAENATVVWVDLWSGVVHETDPADGHTATTRLTAPLSAVVPTTRGTRVVTPRLHIVELTGSGPRALTELPDTADMRANDAAVDATGRLWVGTMTLPERPKRPGSLWRVEPGRPPVRVLDDLALANGIGWSPDGHTMYVVDSTRQRIDTYAFDAGEGTLGPRRRFATVPADSGMPDGIAVDERGGVWVALAGGGAVRCYDPDGTVRTEITLPVSTPTSCALGGPDGRDLFVTTALRPVPVEQRPAQLAAGAGALFRIRLDVAAAPTHRMEL